MRGEAVGVGEAVGGGVGGGNSTVEAENHRRFFEILLEDQAPIKSQQAVNTEESTPIMPRPPLPHHLCAVPTYRRSITYTFVRPLVCVCVYVCASPAFSKRHVYFVSGNNKSHHAVHHPTHAHQPRQGRRQVPGTAADIQHPATLHRNHRGQHLQRMGVHVRCADGGPKPDRLRSI